MGTQDLQLTSARLELDSRKRTKEKKRNDTDKVGPHVDLLKRLVVPYKKKKILLSITKINKHVLFLK